MNRFQRGRHGLLRDESDSERRGNQEQEKQEPVSERNQALHGAFYRIFRCAFRGPDRCIFELSCHFLPESRLNNTRCNCIIP